MPEYEQEARPLAYTPTWSVASVLTLFVAVSLLMERSIHCLTNRFRKAKRKPLLAALEKMKEELMLLGFMSFLLVSTPGIISKICIPSKFFNSAFSACSRSEIAEEDSAVGEDKISTGSIRRYLIELNPNDCKKGHEPIVSSDGLEQLHTFIFIMAVSHVFYSCLTMVLAIIKIRKWRVWEEEARKVQVGPEITRELTRRQTAVVRLNGLNRRFKHVIFSWVICFFRQFGNSVVRVDYLTLRKAFITKHKLTSKYDFHSYMVRSMEDEFQRIVGVSGVLWGCVVAFMLFNVKGSDLYFWVAIIPFVLILVVGAKLQHIIAQLAMESSGITLLFTGTNSRLRDELFWFKKPTIMLSLIHFTLFQNSFDLASFFWAWWQFGKHSCFLENHILVFLRLLMGFCGQFLCSYITLPLYALVTLMGTHYKAALIPERVRATLRGWGKAARKRRKRRKLCELRDNLKHKTFHSTTDESDSPRSENCDTEIELQNLNDLDTNSSQVYGETSTCSGLPPLRPSASTSASNMSFSPTSIAKSSSLSDRRN